MTPRSLNEGRGRDPGDTSGAYSLAQNAAARAQRRPGPRPRRHDVIGVGGGVVLGRSTKAGAETPATRGGRVEAVANRGRSTKAGAETPATLLIGADTFMDATRKPVCRRLTAILTTGSARVWVWMSSQTRRCPPNLRRITTLPSGA